MIPLFAVRKRPRDTRFPMGQVIVDSLMDAHLSEKEAAIAMGFPDATQLSKAIHGGAPLDLWDLWKLPRPFWPHFFGNCSKALILFWAGELLSPLRMARAEIDSVERKEKSS